MPIEAADLFAARAAAAREEEPHSLPELFLENTKLRPHQVPALARRVREVPSLPGRGSVLWQTFKSYPSSPRTALPEPVAPPVSPSLDVLLRRAPGGGERPFSGRALPVEHLSLLLLYAYGVVRRGPSPAPPQGALAPPPPPYARSCPSAGGLYPLELYVVARDVRGVDPGIYHYDAAGHSLELLRGAEELEAGVDALFPGGAADHAGAPALVVTTGIPLRTAWLHGDRGYRMMLAESGRAAQNLHLGGMALGLAVLPAAHFLDDAVHRLLDLDGLDEVALDVSLAGPAA